MAASQLEIYDGALYHLGERRLASLTESVESRRVLDRIWDARAIEACLEMGHWTFATRSSALSYSPSITPPFGYAKAFDKPSDWIRTVQLCLDERFRVPLIDVLDQGGYWFADPNTIYVRYISNDALYGKNYSLWTESFTDLLKLYMAVKAAPRIPGSESHHDRVHKAFKDAKIIANGIDGTNKPTQPLPMGSWAGARHGGGWGRGSRGPDR